MGTNYYVKRNKPADLTKFCKEFNNDWDSFYTRIKEIEDEEIHLGKSSCGWRFLFHDCLQFHNYPEFEVFINSIGKEGPWKDYHIEDEYGDTVTASYLLDLIATKQNEPFRNGDGSPAQYEQFAVVRDGYRFSDADFS